MPSCLLTIFFDGLEAFRIVLAGPFYHQHQHGRGRLRLGSHAGAARGVTEALLRRGWPGDATTRRSIASFRAGTRDPARVKF